MEKSYKFSNKDNTKQESTEHVFGIDLGTTNSVISYMGGAKGTVPTVISEESKFTIPSCVMWNGGDDFTVGEEAYEHRYQPNVVYSMKKLMGSNGFKWVELNGSKKKITPVLAASLVLKALKERGERRFGLGRVNKVVITVPAYFNDSQRKDTIKAGEMAGLTVLSVINEPTSVAIAYGLDKEADDKNILVYDLGGGTFDTAVCKFTSSKVSSNEIENEEDIFGLDEEEDTSNQTESEDNSSGAILHVLDSNGDTKLGGDDVDELLFETFCKKVDKVLRDSGAKNKKNFKASLSLVDKEKYILRLEKMKKGSSNASHEMTVYTKYGKVKIYMDAIDLVNAFTEIFRRTEVLMDSTLQSLHGEKIDKVILVGGSTKSKTIRELLKKKFPEAEFYTSLDPDKSISLGAAVKGDIDSGNNKSIKIIDVNPIPIGFEITGGMMDMVIPRNQVLPFETTRTFTLSNSEADDLEIKVFQGKNPIAEHNHFLGLLTIELPKAVKSTDPDDIDLDNVVVVGASLDLNNVLTIKVSVRGVDEVKVLKKPDMSEIKDTPSDTKMDKAYRVWERLAKKDSKLRELLDSESSKEEIIKYIQGTRTAEESEELKKKRLDLEDETSLLKITTEMYKDNKYVGQV